MGVPFRLVTAGFEEPDFALIAGIAELCMVVIFANPERKAKDSELTSRDQRYGLDGFWRGLFHYRTGEKSEGC